MMLCFLTHLIRDPGKSIESFFLKGLGIMSPEKILDFTRSVFRFDMLVLIAERYRKLRGRYPIIVEAEDLCQNPTVTMQRFCEEGKFLLWSYKS